jgi:hypothetical protein
VWGERTFATLGLFPEDLTNATKGVLVELVEPDAAGGAGGMLPVRFLNELPIRGGALPNSGDIQASGAYHFALNVNDPHAGQFFQQYWAAPLVFNATTGAANFSCDLGGPRPSFEGCVLLGGVNTTANSSQVFMARAGFGQLQLPVTRDGLLIAFDADKHVNGGMHLGAMRVGGSDWLWKASPWGAWAFNASWQLLEPGPVNVSVGFLEPATVDGRFGANASGINYAGGRAVSDGGDNVVYAFHGVRRPSTRTPRRRHHQLYPPPPPLSLYFSRRRAG